MIKEEESDQASLINDIINSSENDEFKKLFIGSDEPLTNYQFVILDLSWEQFKDKGDYATPEQGI